MTRLFSTIIRLHSLQPLDMFFHILDWDKCTLQEGEKYFLNHVIYVEPWKHSKDKFSRHKSIVTC